MKKLSIHPRETWELSDGTKVIDFTGRIKRTLTHAHFCFGYIFETIYIGNVHHAEIMAWLQEQGKSWEEMFTSEQRWGWCYNSGNTLKVRYATDDAKQSPGLGEKVIGYFDEFFTEVEVVPEGGDTEGYSSQDNYGQRTRVQYQGDPEGEGEEDWPYCEWCEDYMDPDYHDFSHEEYCNNCGNYYTPDHADEHDNYEDYHCDVCDEYYSDCVEWKHGENHPRCTYCDELYDAENQFEHEKHSSIGDWAFCWTDKEHYLKREGEPHRYHETTETGLSYGQLPPGNQTDKSTTYIQAAKDLYAQFVQGQATHNWVPEGLAPVQVGKGPREQTIKAMQEQFPGITEKALTQVVDLAIADQGNQMALFSKWEDRTAVDRGIHDDSDRYVFAKLAVDALSSGVREDQELLDIEANPNSTEYRWSYDGHDLHIWQVTNRRQYGPSHYDMFGSEGYDYHSQGRVYVSPTGEVGSLYWQISHPECEDVINQWIQKTFGKPPDYVYHSYGQYPGEVRGRGMYPLVDVMWLPFKDNEKWWLDPAARPDKWYQQQGLTAPKKRRQKQPKPYVAPSQQEPTWKNNPAMGISDQDWKNMGKKERRRLRRQRRNKGGGGKVRGRGRRMGNINVISYEYNVPAGAQTGIWDEWDAPVHKFVFDADGALVVAPESDMNIRGDYHHQDLWNTEDFSRMGARAFTNGFLVLGNMEMAGQQLKPGDIWFHEKPEPQEIKAVKSHFGKDVRRVRWYGMDYAESS